MKNQFLSAGINLDFMDATISPKDDFIVMLMEFGLIQQKFHQIKVFGVVFIN